MAVVVRCRLGEQSVERVEEIVLVPLMRAIAKTPKVKSINGNATRRRVDVEIQFDGAATEADLSRLSGGRYQLAVSRHPPPATGSAPNDFLGTRHMLGTSMG
ncbi:hypothetical protein GCM10008020_15160 [Massilia psychrophila]|nr:hypothetical protein GCM10008020_15160 [Massilia psychrophila]